MKITFEINPKHGPALRALIEEMSRRVGKALEAPALYATEQALTNAAAAVGALRAAVTKALPVEYGEALAVLESAVSTQVKRVDPAWPTVGVGGVK